MEKSQISELVNPLEVIANRVNTFLTETIKEEGEALRQVDIWRSQGFKIVVTEGCFDLAHRQHGAYLLACKYLVDDGGKLMVMVDTDELMMRRKNKKPINPVSDRMAQIAEYRPVDLVTKKSFTGFEWIKTVRPDIIVRSTTTGSDSMSEGLNMLFEFIDENNLETQVVVFDTKFNIIPAQEAFRKGIEYEDNKTNEISSTNIKQKIIDGSKGLVDLSKYPI